MSSVTSTLLPLHRSGPGENASNRASIPELSMSTTFQLFDISEDNGFLALIDDNFMLQAYKINISGHEMVIERQTMKDIPCNIDCENSICVYISVASETGHVAVSFLQLDSDTGECFLDDEYDNKSMIDERYIDCKIYRENEAQVLKIPFQGRAAFTKDKLVLHGYYLDIYDAKTFKKVGSFKINFIDFRGDSPGEGYRNPSHYWRKQYLRNYESRRTSNHGDNLDGFSEHIRKDVVVVYRCTSNLYPKSFVTIWSILTGSLLCSFDRGSDEYITSISENSRFIVASDVHGKSFSIYCMKSGTYLHTYRPQGPKSNTDQSTILLVKLMAHHSYMLIMGIITKQDEESHEGSRLFFDVYSIAQQRRIKYSEKNVSVSLGSCFPVGIFREDCFSNNSSDDVVYFPSKFYGVFLEKANSDNLGLTYTAILLNDSEPSGLKNGILWGTFSCQLMGAGSWVNNTMNIFDDRLDSDQSITWHLLQSDTHSYILRFSSEAMQFWQLVVIGDESTEERLTLKGSDYYRNTANSTLIYARGYAGINMYKTTMIDNIWMTERVKMGDYKLLHIHFTEAEGRILVYTKIDGGEEIVDEIFLPLPTSNDNISYSMTKDDFHSIESSLLAFRNMYFYRLWSRTDDDSEDSFLLEKKIEAFSEKNKKLLISTISSIGNTAYFQTISASNVLVDLLNLRFNVNIIKDIILENKLTVSIFNSPTDANENRNILTMLLRLREYDLFQMLFNQAILDHYNGSTVNLYPLVGAILYLAEIKRSGLLLECIDNLSYITVEIDDVGLDFSTTFELAHQPFLENFTTFHDLKDRNRNIMNPIYQSIFTLMNWLTSTEVEDVSDFYHTCVVPVPTPEVYGAISYAILTKNSPYYRTKGLNETPVQKNPIIEALLIHRWNAHIKHFYYAIFFIQILFYIFYAISVSFPEEVFGYTPGSPFQHTGHKICLLFTCLTWVIFWFQEVKQMYELGKKYWISFYNYIDFLAITLPLVTFIILRLNSPHLYDISSFTSLVLCVQFILRLRVYRRMGILIEIVIQLGLKITPILGLMLLLLFSFTYSFVVLLRRQDDSFFQEQYGGDVIPTNSSALGSGVKLSDQSQQNLFKDVFLAFTSVWLFLYGVFDPILSGDVGNYPMALILAILFTFITALVIFNVVIALMTGAIDETEKRGNINWHIHLADVSKEVESILPWFVKKCSAKYVYYFALKDEVELHHEKLQNKTDKLREKILRDRQREKQRGH